MIGVIKIHDFTGLLERGEKAPMNRALKKAWLQSARYWHDNFREKRFTQEHAQKAGYTPRKGTESGIGSKKFFRSYTGRKFKKFGHTRPLEFTGETRRKIRSFVSLSSTSKGGKAAYPDAKKFNYRNSFSPPTMNLNLEFRTLLPEETEILAKQINDSLSEFWHTKEDDQEVLELLYSAGIY